MEGLEAFHHITRGASGAIEGPSWTEEPNPTVSYCIICELCAELHIATQSISLPGARVRVREIASDKILAFLESAKQTVRTRNDGFLASLTSHGIGSMMIVVTGAN